MSLECEGDGAPCIECGEFDFLPHRCPWCGGIFCSAHATYHHIPAPAAPPLAGASSAIPLSEERGVTEVSHHPPLICKPAQGASTLTVAEATLTSPASTGWPDQRCVVCQSVLCALVPCLQCGYCFCAAHRFHSHEGTEDKPLKQPPPNRRTVSRGSDENNTEKRDEPTAVFFAQFTSANPLVLAPVGYRGPRMDVLAIIVEPAIKAATSVTETVAHGSVSSTYNVGVCSLIVATEMSVGQLRDRLVAFLRGVPTAVREKVPDSGGTELSGSWRWSERISSAHASLFSLAPVAITTGSVPKAGLLSHRVPTLSLVPLPLDASIRKAPIMNAAVVCSLPTVTAESTAPDDFAALLHFVTAVLYGTATPSSTPPSTAASSTSATDSAHRDGRVKALAVRLNLQHQQMLRRAEAGIQGSRSHSAAVASDDAGAVTTQSPVHRTGGSAQEIMAPVGRVPASEGDSTSLSLAAPAHSGKVKSLQVAAVWPFRQGPPLNRFDFFNSKMRPCGAAEVRPAGAPRIIVAVFVADAFLPVPVKPMCIAVGREWPLVRVVNRVRDEVIEQQFSQCRDTRATLDTFSVYHLGSGNSASSTTAGGTEDLVCLWSGCSQSSTPPVPVVLQSADVLFLCPADSSECEVALLKELQNLRGLTGRAKTALQADQLKKCAVM